MGNLEIHEDSAVKGLGLKPVPDFCVTEEVVGGVHDNNRLGDISLLDHAVFSRVTKSACARYMLDDRDEANSLAAIGGGELRGRTANRPSLLAVVGPICQQSTPNWKNVDSMVLLDRSSFCDGNSTVATSGIDRANVWTLALSQVVF